MKATVSILGLYRYDETIFKNMVLPQGIDRELLINTICLKFAEQRLIYSDPEYLKFAIGCWSLKNTKVWEKLFATTTVEYNPIHNYDRTEEWDDSETRDLHGQSAAGATNLESGAAFNSESLMTRGQNKSDSSATSSDTGTISNKRRGRAFGNIGVTTTQQMLESERQVVKFNIYDFIAESFENEFCLLVY